MPSIIDGWRELRVEIEKTATAVKDLGGEINQIPEPPRVLPLPAGQIAGQPMGVTAINVQTERQKMLSEGALHQAIRDLKDQLFADGILSREDVAQLQALAQGTRDSGGSTLGERSSSGSSGGGGGSRGPSGKDGDPVSCSVPGTEDAINQQTSILSGWLQALFDSSESKSYGSQYIGKPLYLRPGQGE